MEPVTIGVFEEFVMKKVLLLASIVSLLAGSAGTAALAQRSDNPNMKMFYMARQQIQITDDVPVVNDMRTNPAAAQQSAAAAAAAAKAALPRAGFGSNMAGLQTPAAAAGLPKVNNGVPVKLPEAGNGTKGLKAGNAGKLKAKGPPVATQQSTPVAKTYKPYATTPVAQSSGSSGSLLNSSTSVQGSVLHWNKRH
jgi:hypothetical protein